MQYQLQWPSKGSSIPGPVIMFPLAHCTVLYVALCYDLGVGDYYNIIFWLDKSYNSVALIKTELLMRPITVIGKYIYIARNEQ